MIIRIIEESIEIRDAKNEIDKYIPIIFTNIPPMMHISKFRQVPRME